MTAGCGTPPGARLSELTLDAGADEAILVLQTTSRIQGLSDTDPYDLRHFDPETGARVAGVRQGRFQLSGVGGEFVFAKVPAGFHVIHAYESVHGPYCYETETVGVDVGPGEIVFMGTLDPRQTQKDATAAASRFLNRYAVSPESPEVRDRVEFELSRNFTAIDTVTMKREFYYNAVNLPFDQYKDAEHTYRVERTLYLTAMLPPRITAPTAESLAAAQTYLREKRPDLTQAVTAGTLQTVYPIRASETCDVQAIEMGGKE